MNAIQRLISETECGANAAEEAREVQIGKEIKTLLAAVKAQGDQADPAAQIEKLVDELIAMHAAGGAEAPACPAETTPPAAGTNVPA